MINSPPVPRDSDRQLEGLIEQYGGLIRRVIARVAGPRLAGQHDDIGQQVLVNLWRQLEREQTIEHPASYIYRAAVREAVRAIKRVTAESLVALDDDASPEPADAAPTPEQVLAGRQRGDAIVKAMQGLSPDRRTAVRAHLAGFSVTEVMDMHGWPYQKARNLIARGIADLRAALAHEAPGD
jgi:RNA polymerase sigma factor (sigma-70 family)